jgi:pimeloyl-ACP methyl ester carboxylesterase
MSEKKVPVDKWIHAGDLRMHYLDWGNALAGSMLLVHGMCTTAHGWDFFAVNMKEQYHVLAPDLRGHGESDWSPEYHIGDYVDDLSYFVNNLDLENIVLIGHSLGGVITAAYAANHPEKVDRLVIVDIGPELKTQGLERRNREWKGGPFLFNSTEEVIKHLSAAHPYHSPEYIQHLIKHDLIQDTDGRIVFKFDPKTCEGEMHSPGWLWDYVEMIVCPTLVIHGAESDLFSGEEARRLAATLAFGSAVDVDHAAHTVQGDNPEMFESVVRSFLEGPD